MEILFNKDLHQYSVNKEIAGISVTQLLRKHGLAPSYNGVSAEVLNAKAERGTSIHKDLECLIKHPNYTPMTTEGEAFKKYIDDFIDAATAEQLLAYKYKAMWVAGTADVVGFFKKKDKGCFVADHKTTYSINKEYVSWQCSILDYMLRHLNEPINGKVIKWKGANELLCFHYDKDGELTVIKLDRVPDEEIEALFEAEYTGQIYQRKELVVEDEIKGNLAQIRATLESINAQKKQLEQQEAKYKEIILQKMEEQGIKSFEDKESGLKLTYVGQQERVMVDGAKLLKFYPEIYAECTKISKQKAYVKVSIKGDQDEDN